MYILNGYMHSNMYLCAVFIYCIEEQWFIDAVYQALLSDIYSRYDTSSAGVLYTVDIQTEYC